MKNSRRIIGSFFVVMLFLFLIISNIGGVKGNVGDFSIYLPLILKSEATIEPTPEPTPEPLLAVGSTVYFDIFSGLITGAEKVDYLIDDTEYIYPGQVFLIVYVDVANLDFVSDYVSRYDLRIQDSLGRLFDMAVLEVQLAAEDQYGLSGVYQDIQPSFVEKQVYVFDIALDSVGLELVPGNYSPPITPTPNPLPTSVVNLGTPGNTAKWEYTITNVISTATLTGDSSVVSAKGEFLVVFATVRNLGLESAYISRYDFVIQDSITRQFDMAELEVQWAAEDQYGLSGVYEDIQPGFTEQQVFVFDIASSASGLYFLPTELGDAVDLN